MVLRMLSMKMSVIFIAGIIWSVTTFSQSAVKTAISSKDIPATTSSNTPAISASRIEPLQIGDEVPDIEFTMLNYPKSKARLSDFRGKLVILDFWATWCTACIKNFSKIDSLYTKFEGKVQFVLVNSKKNGDDYGKMISFLNKWKQRYPDFKLPIAILDTVATQLFPHKIIPHYVWIDLYGAVHSITGSSEVSITNIANFISGKRFRLRQKQDINIAQRDSILYSNLNPEKIKFRSLITGYMEGVSQGRTVTMDSNRLVSRLLITNYTIIQLYQIAFRLTYPKSRTVLEVSDSSKFIYGNWDEWVFNNVYCYEVITKPTNITFLYKRMQSDLVNCFGFTVAEEKRKVKCLVLQPLSRDPELENRLNIENGDNSKSPDEEHSSIVKSSFDLALVLEQVTDLPVVDELGIDSNMNVGVPLYNKDFIRLKNLLNSKGVDLIEEERELVCLVVRDGAVLD